MKGILYLERRARLKKLFNGKYYYSSFQTFSKYQAGRGVREARKLGWFARVTTKHLPHTNDTQYTVWIRKP